MKTPLVALLVLSLAGNAVLAFFALRASPSAIPAPAAAIATAGSTKPGAVTKAAASTSVELSAAGPINWQTLKPGANLRTLVDNLRAAGFPPAVIRAVANQMISERLNTGAMDHLPFWKQNQNNPEYVAAQQEQNIQRREMLADLLGADARPSVTMDPAARERRYGQLSDEKVDQLENLRRDMDDLRMQLYASRKPGDMQGMMSTQQVAEKELQAELATLLSPTEVEQYEMRSSQSASKLMSNLKDLDVSEEEYTALFRAQKAYDAANPMRSGVISADVMAQRYAAQAALNEQARAVLPDDRFYEYLKGSDFNYAQTVQFTAKYPDITPATTYELNKIEQDYRSKTMAMMPVGGTASAERGAQLMAARKEYQEKLNTLLGTEVATAYAQRNRTGITTTIRTGGN